MEEYNNQAEAPQSPQPMQSSAAASDLTFDVAYSERISRLFIFRFLWGALIMWVFMIWGMVVSIVMFFQFWHQLILGRRHRGMWSVMVAFYDYMTRWNMYWNFMIDQRPPIIGSFTKG